MSLKEWTSYQGLTAVRIESDIFIEASEVAKLLERLAYLEERLEELERKDLP